MHDLDPYAFELPGIDEWLAGDDRVLAFRVTDDDGTGIDIDSADVSWALFERAYQSDPADAVLTDSDSGVEVVTDNRVDTTAGEWEVRLDGAATEELHGRYYQRPALEQSDGTEASWRGTIILTA